MGNKNGKYNKMKKCWNIKTLAHDEGHLWLLLIKKQTNFFHSISPHHPHNRAEGLSGGW